MPSLVYRTHATDATDQTTYSFASVDIGAADATRYVIVALAARNSTADRTVSSATIAGVSASIVADGSAANTQCAILMAAVPTGTTGTIAITFSAAQLRCGIAVWAAYNLRSATAIATLATASATLNVNAVTNGFVVGITSGISQTPVWSGLTEVLVDTSIETTFEMGAASASLVAEATPRAISISGAGTTPFSAIASFR